MNVVKRNLNQTATLWSESGISDYGDATFATPVTVSCRWIDEPWIQPTSVGEQARDHGVVYLDSDQAIGIGDRLFLGTSVVADPRDQAGARLVDHISVVPSLRGDWSAKKAFICGQ